MLTIAYILMAIGGAALLVGGVLLVVAAFRINTGWGLVVLLLSWLIVPLVVFALRYWPKARTGLLVAFGGLIASGLGWFVFVGSAAMALTEPEPFDYASSADSLRLEEREGSELGNATSEADQQPTAAVVVSRPTATPTPEPTEIPEPTPTQSTSTKEQVISYQELEQYVGERIFLELTDGTSMRVVLQSVSPQRITAAQRMGGGWVSYPVQRDTIREIRLPR